MGRGLIYRQIRNPALFALVLLMRATPWFGFVIQVPGHPVSIAESVPMPFRAAIGCLVAALLLCAWLPQGRGTWALQAAAALTLLPLCLWAAKLAERYPAPPAHTMLGAGFWWLTGLTTLAAADALWRLMPLRTRREKGVLF